MPAPTRPRLQQGETPQSPSFQERWNEYLRALALHEAEEMQKEIRAEEAAKNAARNVLDEVSSAPLQTETAPTSDASAGTQPSQKPAEGSNPKGLKGAAQTLRGRGKSIDSAVEAALHGVQEANEANKR